MKPFDYEAYKKGAKVVTRDGVEVTEIYKFEGYSKYPYVALINSHVWCYKEAGSISFSEEHGYDLFMVPSTVKRWLVLYRYPEFTAECCAVFESEEAASKFRPVGEAEVKGIFPVEYEE